MTHVSDVNKNKVKYFQPERESWQKATEEINLKLQVGWSIFELLKTRSNSIPSLIFLCVFLPFLRGYLCIHLFLIPAGPLLSCGLFRPHQADPPAQLQLLSKPLDAAALVGRLDLQHLPVNPRLSHLASPSSQAVTCAQCCSGNPPAHTQPPCQKSPD